MNIIILSRPVHSGKTTEVANWCAAQNNCAGMIMPDVDGVRKIRNLATGEEWDVECKNPAVSIEPLLTIGRFSFYKKAFDLANDSLLLTPVTNVLVIDEIGKLELTGQGFDSSLQLLLHQRKWPQLVLVVRSSLLQQVVLHYNIHHYKVVADLKEMK